MNYKSALMESNHSSLESLLENMGLITESSLQPASIQVQTPTNWREIWNEYINDCANQPRNAKGKTRSRRRKKKKVLDRTHLWNLYMDFVQKPTTNYLDSVDVDDQEAADKNSTTESDKRPNGAIEHLECNSECSNTAIVSNYNFLDSHCTKIWNLYKDFVYKPKKKTKRRRRPSKAVIPKDKLSIHETLTINNSHVYAECDNAKTILNTRAVESNSKSQIKHNGGNQKSKRLKSRPRFYRRKTPGNDNQNRKPVNSTSSSNSSKQFPLYALDVDSATMDNKNRHVANPQRVGSKGSIKTVVPKSKTNRSQTISNGSDTTRYTSKGVKRKNKTSKGATKHFCDSKTEICTAAVSNTVDRKTYSNNNKMSHVLKKSLGNQKTPTTSWEHLWNLHIDFGGTNTLLPNRGIAVKNFTESIKDPTTVTRAGNWHYLRDLYLDFFRTLVADSSQFEFVAIDCEMVEVGGIFRQRALARVSVVDQQGKVLLDKFVKPRGVVTDYMTEVSGIRPQDIENGETFRLVRNEVAQLIKDKIIVGHGLDHDLHVLRMTHPFHARRDTAVYGPLRRYATNGRTPGLKLLCKSVLGIEIQSGEHSSVEDARAVMKLYNSQSSKWENFLRKQ